MATLALPGDRFSIASTSAVKLGPGLAVHPSEGRRAAEDGHVELIALTPGLLGEVRRASTATKRSAKAADETSSPSSTAIWVESTASRRYIPQLHDHVVCQITNRGVEAYQVTLLTSFTSATLPALSFEGATKRNKPNLRVGTLLYAQVSAAHRHAEPELTCVDPTTGKSNGFGELKTERDEAGTSNSSSAKADKEATAANVWPVSCSLARSLLLPHHTLLARLATHFPFEVAIGVNGLVWVRARSARHVIAVGKVLEHADRVARHAPPADEEGVQLDALKVAKLRGALDPSTIAKLVEPFH